MLYRGVPMLLLLLLSLFCCPQAVVSVPLEVLWIWKAARKKRKKTQTALKLLRFRFSFCVRRALAPPSALPLDPVQRDHEHYRLHDPLKTPLGKANNSSAAGARRHRDAKTNFPTFLKKKVLRDRGLTA